MLPDWVVIVGPGGSGSSGGGVVGLVVELVDVGDGDVGLVVVRVEVGFCVGDEDVDELLLEELEELELVEDELELDVDRGVDVRVGAGAEDVAGGP